MKIIIFDIEDWECSSFEDLNDRHEIEFIKESLTTANADSFKDAEIVSIFMYSSINKEVLDKLPNLKMIATRSTGVDHIDIETCRQRGVVVSNVPSYGKNTVAEHVFALLLTISHRMEEALDRTRKGDFSPRGLEGFDLRGKTLGVIGTGDIGKETIRIARGFGMNVMAFDKRQDSDASSSLDFDYVNLDELLEGSDIVTLHVPATEETHHLISSDQFSKMKDGVVLINTARGDVVDMRALARALAEKKVSAAGLDVLTNEPVIREEAELLRSVYEEEHDLRDLLADEVLIRMRNVVVTPHSAFNTKEAVHRILTTTLENIQSFVDESPKNAVGA